MFALRRKLLISVHTSFDMNLMKDSRSFINRGQAETVFCIYQMLWCHRRDIGWDRSAVAPKCIVLLQ